MTTLVTGAGLIGTAFAQHAIARGETVVFLDPEPRDDFLRMKLGDKGYALVRKDVRDLPAIIETIKEHKADGATHLITGDLTLHGTKKTLSFPAKVATTDDTLTLESQFTFDRTDYGMTFGKGRVDNVVSLDVAVDAKK